MDTIKVYLENIQIQGDTSQFMQQSKLFKFVSARTVIELEPNPKHVYNPEARKYWEDYKVWEISSNGDKPKLPEDLVPVLTVEGTEFVIAQIQSIMTPHHPYADVVDEDEFDFE